MDYLGRIQIMSERIREEFGYSVHLCGEIEFAFLDENPIGDHVWQELLNTAEAEKIPLESIGKESNDRSGIQQYECRFKSASPERASKAVNWLNGYLEGLPNSNNLKYVKSSFLSDKLISNGLHWHLHVLDVDDNYSFMKQEENLSDSLSDILGGLLHTMPALMDCFMPEENSYQRITSGLDHVPTRICWGGNNRSVALRLPESVISLRHIEHRVCGGDADPYASVWALLVGIHYGLSHHPGPGEQCFGDANRPESEYPLLPRSAQEAEQAREAAGWLRDYL